MDRFICRQLWVRFGVDYRMIDGELRSDLCLIGFACSDDALLWCGR